MQAERSTGGPVKGRKKQKALVGEWLNAWLNAKYN